MQLRSTLVHFDFDMVAELFEAVADLQGALAAETPEEVFLGEETIAVNLSEEQPAVKEAGNSRRGGLFGARRQRSQAFQMSTCTCQILTWVGMWNIHKDCHQQSLAHLTSELLVHYHLITRLQ